MKKQLMRVVSAKPLSKFFTATALVLIVSGTSYVNAQAIPVSATIERADIGKNNAEINHIGTNNGMLLFEVKVKNKEGERFRVTVKDADGTVLFQDYYSEKNFNKKFMIPKPENDKLIFVIKGASGNLSQSFEINSTSHMVEEVEVTRI